MSDLVIVCGGVLGMVICWAYVMFVFNAGMKELWSTDDESIEILDVELAPLSTEKGSAMAELVKEKGCER